MFRVPRGLAVGFSFGVSAFFRSLKPNHEANEVVAAGDEADSFRNNLGGPLERFQQCFESTELFAELWF